MQKIGMVREMPPLRPLAILAKGLSARALVAEFFGETEYEIRKAIKLTQLIPELADILENSPKQLNWPVQN